MSAPEPGPGDALLIVDVQKDFLPGGALAVPKGEEVVAPLSRWAERFDRRGLPVFATRDWHPAGHCSFRAQGGPWPPHCVAGTAGAQFADGLRLPSGAVIVSKAVEPSPDACSGFQGTALAERLRRLGVRRVFVGGLATDYCVKETARDALRAGLAVVVLEEAVRAIDEPAGREVLAELAEAGAVMS